MQAKTIFAVMLMAATALGGAAQVSLDSCRQMALRSNKDILMASERVTAAGYQRAEARAAYLPSLDLTAGYLYNQKNIALIEHDALLPTQQFNPATGSYDFSLVTGADGRPVMANGQPVPTQVALLPKSAMTYDIHNVFAGAITLTQPVYMGGKIKAMNDITRYAEQLAAQMHSKAMEDVVYQVDAAYWTVVSLRAKQELARGYVALLDTLGRNVQAMLAEGIATRADALSVEVKRNEARVDLTRVDNGLTLARMQLAQICGLSLDTQLRLQDEGNSDISHTTMPATAYNIDDVLARRHEVSALELGVKIHEQKAKVALSGMLPQLAVIGAYSVSNPNSFDGFKNRFAGAFSVGATLKVPLWHWRGDYNKYRAARAETVIQRLQLQDARERITLQVKQAAFKAQEAVKTYHATRSNMASAEENLRTATLGFKEGVMTTDNVMTAQTAWLKASSEAIDAQIDVQLCNVYLQKTLGTLQY